jgi:peptide-methionine (S)-S-oxide reductase
MEPPYDKLDGVLDTTSGYIGGSVVDPFYEQVTRGTTGHAEAVQVTYDPAQVDYQTLLDVFWRNIDPLDEGGQFCDRGGTTPLPVLAIYCAGKVLALGALPGR